MTTLFGHLAPRFTVHPENLATEALCFILRRSAAARNALVEHLKHTGTDLPQELVYRTQATGEDGAIPDVEGVDVQGRAVLVVEAKFWAGLTHNQPVTYLNNLPSDADSLLVFVVPAQRIIALWDEVTKRSREAEIPVGEMESRGAEFRWARLDQRRSLVMLSWRSVLDALSESLRSGVDTASLSDIEQLRGLCDRMDNKAFLPLQSEELAPERGRRVGQFCNLVDEVVQQLETEGLANTKGLRSASTIGRYGRYFQFRGQGLYLYFTAWGWSSDRPTPLWLKLWGADWTHKWSDGLALREHLASLEATDPPKIVYRDSYLGAPLNLPLGVEKEEVIADLVRQIREVLLLLPKRDQIEDDQLEEAEQD
jgi:hypothetical protein